MCTLCRRYILLKIQWIFHGTNIILMIKTGGCWDYIDIFLYLWWVKWPVITLQPKCWGRARVRAWGGAGFVEDLFSIIDYRFTRFGWKHHVAAVCEGKEMGELGTRLVIRYKTLDSWGSNQSHCWTPTTGRQSCFGRSWLAKVSGLYPVISFFLPPPPSFFPLPMLSMWQGTFFLFPVLCGLAIFVGVYVLSHQYDVRTKLESGAA